MASESVEEYIEAIYRLGGEDGTVSTCDLADQLSVSPPSVTTMLRRLSRDGLVTHTRYRGIILTPLGRNMAVSTLRRHRLSERLLTDVLGMSWESVHDAACKLEHVITGEIETKAYEILGHPKTCPHGNPICCSEDRELTCLTESRPGDMAQVAKVADEGDEVLKAVAAIGLKPTAEFTVKSVSIDGVAIEVGGEHLMVTNSIAEHIWIEPIPQQ